ncbi:TetR/AcrR family transcriptional regulator [Cohnella sp.]|uniref:TetR/AcrR family transcriptional regulator n=1 Tax=Cohnella sp. TaxID=1883426 RepID=UPI003563C9A6
MSIRRERKDAAEHRKLILQTAKCLFKEHGVHPVSMHQIAKKAGIGQATLYRRYAHKGDLCFDILQDYGREILEEMNSYLQINQHAPAADRLGGILDLWIDAVEERSDLIIEMESKMNCQDNRGNFFHSPMYRFIREKMSGLIVEIVGANPQLPIDPDLTAHAIICSLSPVGYFYIKQEKGYSREQMKQGFRQMCRLASPV